MARLAHEDVAEVLANIANACIDDKMDPYTSLLKFQISNIITNFLDERSENLSTAYDKKLKIPTEV